MITLITNHEKIDFPTLGLDMLGIESYNLLEEHSKVMEDVVIRWHFLDLLGHELE